jgi:hypothetical protein
LRVADTDAGHIMTRHNINHRASILRKTVLLIVHCGKVHSKRRVLFTSSRSYVTDRAELSLYKPVILIESTS